MAIIKEATKKEREFLSAIIQYRLRVGFMPSIRDLVFATGISQTMCRNRLISLERKGYITRHCGIPRSIVVLYDETGKAA